MEKIDPRILATIITIFGATVQFLSAITQLMEAIRKFFEEIQWWRGFLYGLLIILLTLLIPEGVILFFVLPIVIKYATGYTWDQYIVKMSIAWASAFIGSIYPFLWAIFFSQIRLKLLKKSTQQNIQSEGDKS